MTRTYLSTTAGIDVPVWTAGTNCPTGYVVQEGGSLWARNAPGGVAAASWALDAANWAQESGTSGGLPGVTVSGTPSSGQVLTATSASAATWETPTANNGVTVMSVPHAPSSTQTMPATGNLVLIVGTLTGAVTVYNLASPPADGATVRIRFTQDSTGHAISFGNAWDFGSDITTAYILTSAGATQELIFEYNAALSKYVCVGIVRGY